MQPHRGTMLLVFGLIGILICQVFSVMAWVMGKNDLAEIEAGRMDPEGESNTRAGMILGIVGTIILILSVIFLVVAVVGFGLFAAATEMK